MPYLRLLDTQSGRQHEYERAEVRIGRDPALEYVVDGEAGGIVSSYHCRFVYRARRWWIEDPGSRNGTYVNGTRLEPGAAVEALPGRVVALGTRGPRFRVEAAASRPLDHTLNETGSPEAFASGATGEPEVHLVLFEPRAATYLEASGPVLRIGRGLECELRPINGDMGSVSRIHAEVTVGEEGATVIHDAGSLNGTLVNEDRVQAPRELREGDRISLGGDGPHLIVSSVSPAPREESVAECHTCSDDPAETESPGLAGGVERDPEAQGEPSLPTRLVRKVVAEADRVSSRRARRLLWLFFLFAATAIGALYYRAARDERVTDDLMERQRMALEEQRRANQAQRAAIDSLVRSAGMEYEDVRSDLEAALAASAPAAIVDSLRDALVEANQRTQKLEAALVRAQTSLNQQIALGDSLRQAARAQVERLRAELASARDNSVGPELVDSLRRAVRDAEAQVAGIGSQLRAVKGVNLAALAKENQGAVGLVTAYKGLNMYDGSGFAISASGYFVTNRHVVLPDGVADSVFVTMADEKYMERADVIAVAQVVGPDLALLKIRDFRWPHIEKIDWSGTRASQGEAAALIGFPAGIGTALDNTRTVRTSMSAGIFSKVTADRIQFDGFSVGGSSGSPIFNANGEVVGVHRGSLRGATGLGFAVPIQLLIPLLPDDARRELGL